MNILITNDDGYKAKGLHILAETMMAYGKVTVVSPKRPQSGMSMAVTMGHKPIAVKQISSSPEADWWYLDGTPASCIKFGIDNILWPQKPELVVSGINHGSNASTAAIYSGTIGGAMEGAVNLIPSIGVSLDSYDEDADFSAVRQLLPGIIDKLMTNLKPKTGLFYNINFPALPAEEIKGVRVCHMGMGHWEKEYQNYAEFLQRKGRTADADAQAYIDNAEEGEEIYVMAGDFISNDGNIYPADHLELQQGWITVTPENINNTDFEEIERLCAII